MGSIAPLCSPRASIDSFLIQHSPDVLLCHFLVVRLTRSQPRRRSTRNLARWEDQGTYRELNSESLGKAMHELENHAAQAYAIVLRLSCNTFESQIRLLPAEDQEQRQISNIEQGMTNVEVESAFIIRNSLFDIRDFLLFSLIHSSRFQASDDTAFHAACGTPFASN